eukprot:m.130642 g.130642  ORF g.130642 m.130642 type:complete len:94 (+) comp13059_c1_seq1:972-1253(+)
MRMKKIAPVIACVPIPSKFLPSFNQIIPSKRLNTMTCMMRAMFVAVIKQKINCKQNTHKQEKQTRNQTSRHTFLSPHDFKGAPENYFELSPPT